MNILHLFDRIDTPLLAIWLALLFLFMTVKMEDSWKRWRRLWIVSITLQVLLLLVSAMVPA